MRMAVLQLGKGCASASFCTCTSVAMPSLASPSRLSSSARLKDAPSAVPEMVERALRNGGTRGDNVTVLAVEWEAVDESDSSAGISTRSLGEDVFASTIQASLDDSGSGDLDEAEIERSIREINEAIQRSSKKRS